MPSVCSAYNCVNRSSATRGISYFRFPLKNKELTERWVANIRRHKWFPTRYSYICSSHFERRYMYIVNDKRRLLANAIPTLFSFPGYLQKQKPTAIKESDSEVNLSSNQPVGRVNHSEQTDHPYCLPNQKKWRKHMKQIK